jgi:DNA (cytosine-5)-methyltransferase 1
MRLLDLFCGAGGAAMGYHRAGFTEIVGVDIKPQPRYPFTFVLGDALEYVKAHGHEFDAIHASPPCQGYSIMRHLPWIRGKEYPLLIDATRQAMKTTGAAWVIENVMGAPLDAPFLCGQMFGLRVLRHRLFEASVLWLAPPHPSHASVTIQSGHMLGNRARAYAHTKNRKANYEAGGLVSVTGDIGSYAGAAMGIDWMTGDELSQAIPPAYTEFIGRQLIQSLSQRP